MFTAIHTVLLLLATGQATTNTSALQSSAIDTVVQQILAGVTTSAKETEAKKRELNKVADHFTPLLLDPRCQVSFSFKIGTDMDNNVYNREKKNTTISIL